MAADLSVDSIAGGIREAGEPMAAAVAVPSLHNEVLPVDVDGNQSVTALDALLVINHLNRPASDGPELIDSVEANPMMVDVNGDSSVTAIDALIVINHLAISSDSSRAEAFSVSSISLDEIDRIPTEANRFDFQLSGSSSAEGLVEIRQAGQLVAQTTANRDGSWTVVISDAALIDSEFRYVAVEMDQVGNLIGESPSITFQPNIILVNADDMRYEQTRFMPFLQSLESESTVFEKFYTPTSVSGPSRASLMTGLFAASHGNLNNNAAFGTTLNDDRSSTLPLWMSNAGYRTGLFGKDRTVPAVDARFETQDIMASPPGWDDYVAAIKNGNLGFSSSFTDNGELVEAGPQDYINDLMLEQTLEFIEQTPKGQPFFAYFATNAPHSPGIPAARHAGVYQDEVLPRAPSFSPVPIVSPYRLSPDDTKGLEVFARLMESQYRGGSEALLSADEAMQTLMLQLESTGQLDNSIIIFTADNGRGVGEHGNYYKNKFWEESIHVPLMVWDGRNPVGQTTDSLGTMADLTATLLDFGDAAPERLIEGVSLKPSIVSPEQDVREDFLIQQVYVDGASGEVMKEFGVHAGSIVYVETSQPIGEANRFLYDLENDIYQLDNLVEDPAYASTLDQLDDRLEELRGDDRESPVLEGWAWQASGTQFDLPQQLTLNVTVNDATTGGSEVRTPSLLYGRQDRFDKGFPMESIDGVFDSVRETTFHRMQWDAFLTAARPDRVFVATRDTIGNLSNATQIAIPLESAPRLSVESDTGSSSSDAITIDDTPTFSGKVEPGEKVALFIANYSDGEPLLIGTTTANHAGRWKATVELPELGDFLIYGQVGAPDGAPPMPVRFITPTRVQLVARTSGNEVQVLGTTGDDFIFVKETAEGDWQVDINGVTAGTLPASDRVSINGDRGDDWLEVTGDISSRLIGSSGDDTLIGGSGNDTLIGGRGSNDLSGRGGDDIYQFAANDSQLAAEIIDLLTEDRIREISGQGTDRIRAIGNFAVDAVLDQSNGIGRIEFPNEFGSQRSVIVDDPLAIERIDSTNESSQYTVPADIQVNGGTGDDQYRYSSSVNAGDRVSLALLTSGGDRNDVVNHVIEVNSGEFFVRPNLPGSMTIISSASNRIELTGLRSEINTLLSRGFILVIANESLGEETSVKSISQVIGSDPVQTDELLFVVSAGPVAITGYATAEYAELGPNLRFAAGLNIVSGSNDFQGGHLSVSIIGDTASQDSLTLPSQGPGPRSVRVIGNEVLYGDVLVGVVGEMELGSGELRIEFNENADTTSIQAIARRLMYRHLSSDPGSDRRTIRLSLTDAGGANDVFDIRVAIDLQNEAPILGLSAAAVIEYQLARPRFQTIGYQVSVEDAEQDLSNARVLIELSRPASSGESFRLLSGSRPTTYRINFDAARGTVEVNETWVGNFDFVSSERIEFVFNQNASTSYVEAIVGRLQYRNLDATEFLADQMVSFTFIDAGGSSSETLSRTIQFGN